MADRRGACDVSGTAILRPYVPPKCQFASEDVEDGRLYGPHCVDCVHGCDLITAIRSWEWLMMGRVDLGTLVSNTGLDPAV